MFLGKTLDARSRLKTLKCRTDLSELYSFEILDAKIVVKQAKRKSKNKKAGK
jgi:hypothetical protein